MKKALSIFASFSALALLGGCGGGGDDTVDVAKYVGTWEGCITGASGSTRETLVVTKKDEDTADVGVTLVVYSATGCSGTASGPTQRIVSFDFGGTKSIGGETVDKVVVTDSAVKEKNVFQIKGSQFRFGPDNGPRDADGYPNTLDPEFLTKK
jgi:hypothetical protein